MFDFAKERYFDEKPSGNKSNKDKTPIGLTKTPAIIASGISIKILSENPNELCDRLNFLSQEKQAGIISDIIKEESVAIADNLEDKCVSTEQHKLLLPKCLNKMKTMM